MRITKQFLIVLVMATCLGLNAQASSTRSIDADQVKSSDHSKTYSLPAATDTLVGRDSTDTFTNKSIAAADNNITGLATTELDNLGGTAINAPLLPANDGFAAGDKYLGDATHGWAGLYAKYLFTNDDSPVLNIPERKLLNSSGDLRMDWENGLLDDAFGNIVLDFSNSYAKLNGGADFNATNAFNLADPVNPQDGATKAWTEAQITPATQAISASAIDWATGNVFTKTLGANTTFTFSNQASGKVIVVRLTNTASNYTVTWPGGVKWSGGSAPVQTVGAKSDVYTFVYDGSNTYGSAVQNF